MSCAPTTRYFDGFLDDILDRVKVLEIQSYIKTPKTCRKLMQREQGLRDLPVPARRSDLVRSTLIKVGQRHDQQRRSRVAMAGGLLARLANFFITIPDVTRPAHNRVTAREVTLPQDQIHVIKLACNSKGNPDSAAFPIRLPGNVDLQGFPKRQAISRQTRLRQGNNLLILPQWRQARLKGFDRVDQA